METESLPGAKQTNETAISFYSPVLDQSHVDRYLEITINNELDIIEGDSRNKKLENSFWIQTRDAWNWRIRPLAEQHTASNLQRGKTCER